MPLQMVKERRSFSYRSWFNGELGSAREDRPLPKSQIMKTNIIVENLKCNGCANTIRKDVGHLPGVEAVEVNVNSGCVTITHSHEAAEFGCSRQTYAPRLS